MMMRRGASRSVIRPDAREWLSWMCPETRIRERWRLLRWKWWMLLLLDSVDGRVGCSTIVIARWALLFCWMMTIVAATLVALRIVRHLGKRD
jgi:hypothetical protein